ncbi:MAG: hypothetical protein ABSG72_12510, partial [Candidatus Sulfotelmatobacter sp.]
PVFRRRLVLVPLLFDMWETVWVPFRKREGWARGASNSLSYNVKRSFTARRTLALEDQEEGHGD